MKYLVIIIAVLILISAGSVGYLYLNSSYLVHSTSNEKIGSQLTSDQAKDLNSSLKDILNKQSLFIQKLKEDGLSNIARIASLESRIATLDKELKLLLSQDRNIGNTTVPNAQVKTVAEELLELVKDPGFIKKLQQTMHGAYQKQMGEGGQTLTDHLKKRIDQFAKEQYLNDYQQQELSKILTEASVTLSNLGSDLVSQFINPDDAKDENKKSPSLSPQEFLKKTEALKKESNEKIKQILTPQQYEAYEKLKPSLLEGTQTNVHVISPLPK